VSDKRPAPHALDLVIDFVNTADLETGEEALAEPAGLAAWLSGRGLLPAGTKPSARELRGAIELREALRRTMLAHNGGAPDTAAGELLGEVARRGGLSVQFGQDTARLAPTADGLPAALAALLVPVAEAMADDSWRRVKACRAEDCRWAFYDFSRNRAGTWCDMAVCGNREKVRAYRQRAPRAAPRAAS
jgi:predicted RNA-binding Zn ribbon-like protein